MDTVRADESVIRDGDAMRVVPEIAKDLLRSAEGTLGVDYPGVIVEALATAASGAIVGIVLELPRGEQCGEGGQKFAAEEFPEDMHGKQKPGSGRNPARAVARESSARDETVDVRGRPEQIERAWHLPQLRGRPVQIRRDRFQMRVPEQEMSEKGFVDYAGKRSRYSTCKSWSVTPGVRRSVCR